MFPALSLPVTLTLCRPTVVAGAATETLECGGPETVSLTAAVTWFPVEPNVKVGVVDGQVTVGPCWSILNDECTGVVGVGAGVHLDLDDPWR